MKTSTPRHRLTVLTPVVNNSGVTEQAIKEIHNNAATRVLDDGSRSTLRMFTEVEVGEMLRISLSQLRKWRMRKHGEQHPGPPFRKVGRLVRYPARGLQAYIDGE